MFFYYKQEKSRKEMYCFVREDEELIEKLGRKESEKDR